MNNGLCDYVYGSRNFYFHTTLFGICYDSFVFIPLYLVYVMVVRSTNMYVHLMLNSCVRPLELLERWNTAIRGFFTFQMETVMIRKSDDPNNN